MTTSVRSRLRTLAATIALAITVPTFLLLWSEPAHASGDVCDLCSINFDLGACEDLGGYPYDSTQEDPPAAISGGAPAPAPVPAAPAPAAPAPAAPAPAAPAPSAGTSGGSAASGTSSSSSTTTDAAATVDQPAAAVRTAPQAPTAPKLVTTGASLTITWAAPADGGSPITGYKLSLNAGTPIKVAAGTTTYTFPKLGAGSYTATVVATNALGDGAASAVSAAVKVAGPTPAPTVDAAERTAVATDSGAPSWLAGAGILLALVAVGALALLGQRLLRRRRTGAAPTDHASTDVTP
ncbi:fibronectin type III domain-containing protein [Agromyces sp. NPDC057679]|uniref:fibronectin type III domain-containing protein n=1 Tax=Agromyces sp. NPDC057679 TaxID=3346207 RepID=UPI00366AC07E